MYLKYDQTNYSKILHQLYNQHSPLFSILLCSVSSSSLHMACPWHRLCPSIADVGSRGHHLDFSRINLHLPQLSRSSDASNLRAYQLEGYFGPDVVGHYARRKVFLLRQLLRQL